VLRSAGGSSGGQTDPGGARPLRHAGVSRPRADRLELVERAASILRDTPDATANAIYRELGGRRSDVLRAVRAIRAAIARPASPGAS
jgi:hypothetical protein